MNAKIFLPLLTNALLICFVSPLAVAEEPKWQDKMKALADTMGELLPELVSKKGDPKIIEKGAKALSELSHEIKEGEKSKKMVPPSDSDPTLGFLATQFSNQTRRAYSAVKRGNTEYAKDQLRTVTAYCIACHSRHENGPEFMTFPLSEKINKLGKQEKAEIFLATRQFDKGLALFQELIADHEAMKARPFEWEHSVRDALAISVRVKNDPQAAEGIVNAALKSPYLPDFQGDRLRKWKRAIESWKKERSLPPKDQAGYAVKMRRLLTEAVAAQAYPIDRSAEVQYLRASAAAHDVMRVGKDPKLMAEAMLVAGSSYEVLASPSFWPMHEFYYEGCVRQLPHSDMAQTCYNRFEQSVYFGYTGSSGTHLPPDVEELLVELKALAAPVGAKKK